MVLAFILLFLVLVSPTEINYLRIITYYFFLLLTGGADIFYSSICLLWKKEFEEFESILMLSSGYESLLCLLIKLRGMDLLIMEARRLLEFIYRSYICICYEVTEEVVIL